MPIPTTKNPRPGIIWLRLGAIALVTLATLRGAALTKGPYLQAPSAHAMTIMWETLADEPGTLRFGEGGALTQSIGPIRPTRVASPTATAGVNETFYVYEAQLTGLKPGTAYRYQVSVGADTSGPRTFKTFDPNAREVKFIMYGDSRTNPERHAAVVAHFRALSPDFVLHSGDLVAKGTQHELWGREFFAPLKDVIDTVPMLPSIGNHEQDGVNYLTYFHQPGDKRYFYACDIGPVHVLTLDFRATKVTDEQFAFVREDLRKSRAAWKLVLLHVPMFNLGGHASLWGHDDYLPLFRETQVDLVVAGHSHLYERFRPLVPKAQPNAWAIQHVTTGGGGASLAAAVEDKSLAAVFSGYHFVAVTATAERFSARCIDVDGKERDAFVLRKSGGKQDPAWRATAYFEEDVIAKNKTLPRKKSSEKKTASAAP